MTITKNTKSYYSDDNQYTPDYNYYYEPMKQQQSSYETTTMVMTIIRKYLIAIVMKI